MARPIDNVALQFWRDKQKRKQISEEMAKKPPKDARSLDDGVVRVNHTTNTGEFYQRMKTVGDNILYVGIPASSLETRKSAVSKRLERFTSARTKSQKRAGRFEKISTKSTLSNAYLLYLFEKGSPIKEQPPRPVLKPAINAPWNRKPIADLIARSVAEELAGQHYKAKKTLLSAGAKAAKACKEWFDDPRNKWAPNAPVTVLHKKSEKPGIDTGVMRAAITYWLKTVTGTSTPVINE